MAISPAGAGSYVRAVALGRSQPLLAITGYPQGTVSCTISLRCPFMVDKK